jgi:hypothetical protein
MVHDVKERDSAAARDRNDAPSRKTQRTAMPLVLLGSMGLVIAAVGAALAHRSFVLAGFLVLVALVPVFPKERHRAVGVLLAWVGIGASVVSIVLVPLGARVTAVYLPGIVVLFVRIAVLGAASVVEWAKGEGRGSVGP